MTKRNIILSIFVLLISLSSCNKESTKSKQVPIGKRSYFNKILKNPRTGNIPTDYYNQNLDFLRSQLATVNNNEYVWQQAGPNNIGGLTTDIAVARQDANLVFAGGETGGIWKSTDKGSTWSFKTPNQFSLRITSIEQDPIQQNTWYYSASELFKSTDSGDTWTMIHGKINGFDIDKIILNPSNGDVYAYADGSIHKSSDGGNSFTTITTTISKETYQIDIDGKIYLIKNESGGTGGGNQMKGLYVSTDDGVTFTQKMNLPQATLDNFLFRFRIPKNLNNIAWLVSTGINNSALKIDLINDTHIEKGSNLPNFNTQNGHNFIIEVKPNDGNVLVVGGINLFISTDGLNTPISFVNGDITGSFPNHHLDQQAFFWDTQNTNAVWSGHDGGLSYSNSDANAIWVNKNNKFITTQLYKVAIPNGVNDARVVSGAQDNSNPFIKYDTPNYSSPSSLGGDGFSCHFGTQFIYESIQEGEISALGYNANGEPDPLVGFHSLKPTNATTHPFITEFAVDPTEDYMFYLADNEIWRRNNLASQITNNSNWQHLTALNYSGSFTTLSISQQNNVLYYAGYNLSNGNPQIFKLLNCNNSTAAAIEITPTNLPNQATVTSIGVSPVNSNNLLICTSNVGATSLQYSNDGGLNYQSVVGNLTNAPSILSTLISHYNGETRYWAGTSAGLYCAENLNGNNTQWDLVAPEYFGLSEILDLKSRTSDGLIAVATFGRGIVIGKHNDALSVVDNNLINNKPRVFPNPTYSGRFTLKLGQGINNATLNIYSINGQLIKTQEISKNNTLIDLYNIKSGVYLLKINSGNSKWSQKLIYK